MSELVWIKRRCRTCYGTREWALVACRICNPRWPAGSRRNRWRPWTRKWLDRYWSQLGSDTNLPCGHDTALGGIFYSEVCPRCEGNGYRTVLGTKEFEAESAARLERIRRRAEAKTEALMISMGLLRRPTMRCEARTRKGGKCQCRVLVGKTRCKYHGGATPVRRKKTVVSEGD